MVHHQSRLALLLSITLIAASVPTFAQSREPQVLERNVRAELGFLASDAMQGRGSATNYERLAAEYVGSMFRQFGLEPGGDTDASNAPGFVQRVQLETARFVSAPNVTAGAKSWQYGKDFLVTGIRSPRLSGESANRRGRCSTREGIYCFDSTP